MENDFSIKETGEPIESPRDFSYNKHKEIFDREIGKRNTPTEKLAFIKTAEILAKKNLRNHTEQLDNGNVSKLYLGVIEADELYIEYLKEQNALYISQSEKDEIEKNTNNEPDTNPDKIDINFDTVKDIDFAQAVYFVFEDTLNSIKPDRFTTLLKNKAIINITGLHSGESEKIFRNRKYDNLKSNLKKIIKKGKSHNNDTVQDLIIRLKPYKNILE